MNLPSYGFGQTRHARRWPAANSFAVGTVFVRLPMRAIAAQLPQHLSGFNLLGFNFAGFGINRPALIGFADADHGARSPAHGSALAWVDGILAAQDISGADGEVWLHTFPRVLGYAFKPVSFWFCTGKSGGLRAVVAEVHNTFGEQHTYVLRHPDGRDLQDGELLRADKVFHVSPFFPVRGEYQFRWKLSAERAVISITYIDAAHRPENPNEITLSTSISGRYEAISARSTLKALCAYPAQAMTVLARIHWQALKLLAKRVPFYRLPPKPAVAVTTNKP